MTGWDLPRRLLEDQGANLRRLRQAAGLLLEDLADDLGTNAPTLSRIERGQACPSPQLAARVTAWIDQHSHLQTPGSVATSTASLPPHIATPTPPRATHPDTSRKAMTAVNQANAWAIHNWVIEMLGEHPEGATHEQLWMLYVRTQPEARTSQSGLRTRVSELVRGGVVEDSGRTRTMSTGRQAIVWTLKEEGSSNE